MTKPFSLSKSERLKSKKQIDTLFLRGEAFFLYPFRVKFLMSPASETPGLQFGISVPKRQFKKAVHRNRIKRLTREAYRQLKVPLSIDMQGKQQHLSLMFIYTGTEMPDYAGVYETISGLLKKLQDHFSEMNGK